MNGDTHLETNPTTVVAQTKKFSGEKLLTVDPVSVPESATATPFGLSAFRTTAGTHGNRKFLNKVHPTAPLLAAIVSVGILTAIGALSPTAGPGKGTGAVIAAGGGTDPNLRSTIGRTKAAICGKAILKITTVTAMGKVHFDNSETGLSK